MRTMLWAVFLGVFLVHVAPVQAQYFTWGGRFGHPCMATRTVATVDAAGNLYTAGHVCEAADFDPGPGSYILGAPAVDPFVSKIDRAGNLVWAGVMSNGTGANNGLAYGVAVDGTGNVYTVGVFGFATDFDPGPGTAELTPVTEDYPDGYISKLSSTGSFVWVRQISGAIYEDPRAVAVDAAGNLYVTGWFTGTSDFDPGPATFTLTSAGLSDAFVAKLDSAGNFVWARRMGGTGQEQPLGVATDGDGNIVTVGGFEGTADFDPGVAVFDLTSAGGFDIFVSKLDGDGDFVWARRMGGAAGSGPTAVALGADDSVHVVGEFAGTVDFDPGAGNVNLTAGGPTDAFVAKLDAAGDLLWARQFGGPGSQSEAANGVAVGPAGTVHVVGNFDGTADFDPGPGVYALNTVGWRDGFVSILDRDGIRQWVGHLAGNCDGTGVCGCCAPGDNLAHSVAVGLDGSTYTVGQYRGRMDFDPNNEKVELDSETVGGSIFVSRLSPAAFAGAVPDGGGVPGVPLTARRISATTMRLSWGASCGPSPMDYSIYEGQLGNFTSHEPSVCSTEGATSFDISLLPGNWYYLVVPVRDNFEGSYGTNSAGVERPRSAFACNGQSISSCMP